MAVKANRMKALAGLLGDDSDTEDEDLFGSIHDRRTLFDAPKTPESSRTPKSLRGRASMGGMHVARRAAVEGRPDAVNPKGCHSLPSLLGQLNMGSTRLADKTEKGNQPSAETHNERDYAATKFFEGEGEPAAPHRDGVHHDFAGGGVNDSNDEGDAKDEIDEDIVFGRPKTFGAAGGLITDFHPNVRERASAISHWKLHKKDRDGRARALEWRVDDGWINRDADEDISPGSGGSGESGARFGSNGRCRGAPSFLSQFERQSSRDEQDGASANGSRTSRHDSATAVPSSPRFSPSARVVPSPRSFNGYGAKASPKSGGGKATKLKKNATSPRDGVNNATGSPRNTPSPRKISGQNDIDGSGVSPSPHAVPSPRNFFNGYGTARGEAAKIKNNVTSPRDGVLKGVSVRGAPSPQNKSSSRKFTSQGATPSPESRGGKNNAFGGSGTSSPTHIEIGDPTNSKNNSAKTRRENARPFLTRFVEDIENKHSTNGLPSPGSEAPVPPSPRRALSPRNSSSGGGGALLTPSKIKTSGFSPGDAIFSPSMVKISAMPPDKRSTERRKSASPRWDGGTMLVSPSKMKRSSFPIGKLEFEKPNASQEKFHGNAYPNLISSPRGKPPMSPRFTPRDTKSSKTPRSGGGNTPETWAIASADKTPRGSDMTPGSASWEGPFFSEEHRATADDGKAHDGDDLDSHGDVPPTTTPNSSNTSRNRNAPFSGDTEGGNSIESRSSAGDESRHSDALQSPARNFPGDEQLGNETRPSAHAAMNDTLAPSDPPSTPKNKFVRGAQNLNLHQTLRKPAPSLEEDRAGKGLGLPTASRAETSKFSQNPFLRNDASRALSKKRAQAQARVTEAELQLALAKAKTSGHDEETNAGLIPPMEEEHSTQAEPAAAPTRKAQDASDGSSICKAQSSSQNAGITFGEGSVDSGSPIDRAQGSAKAQLREQGKDEKWLPLAKEPLSSISPTGKEKSPNDSSSNGERTPSARNAGKSTDKPKQSDNEANEGSIAQTEKTVQTHAPPEVAHLPLSKEDKSISSQGDIMQATLFNKEKRGARQAQTGAVIAKVKSRGAQSKNQMMEQFRSMHAPAKEVKSLQSLQGKNNSTEAEAFVDRGQKGATACDEGGVGVGTWMSVARGANASRCRAEEKRKAVSTTVRGGAADEEDMPVTPARTPRGYAMSMQNGILRPSPSNTSAKERGWVGPFSPVTASSKRSPRAYELSRQNGVLSPSPATSPAFAQGEAMPFMHKIDSSEVEETPANDEDSSVEDVTPPRPDEARNTEEVRNSERGGDNNGRPELKRTMTPVTEVLEEAMNLLRTPSGCRIQVGSTTIEATDSFDGSGDIREKGTGKKSFLTEADCDNELEKAKRLALALDRFLVSTDSREAERFEEWAVGDGRTVSDEINGMIMNSQDESKSFTDSDKVDDLRSNGAIDHGQSEQAEEDGEGVNEDDRETLGIEIQRSESSVSDGKAWEGWIETPTAYTGPPVETPPIYSPPPVETPPIETPMKVDGTPAVMDRVGSPPSDKFDASIDKSHDCHTAAECQNGAIVANHASFEGNNHASFEEFDQSFDTCGGKDGTNFEKFDQPLDASGFHAFKWGSFNHCQDEGGDAFCPFSIGSPKSDHAASPQTSLKGVSKKKFPKKKSLKKKTNLTVSTSFGNAEKKQQQPKIKVCIGGAPAFKPPEKKDEAMFYVARRSPSCGDGAHLLNGSLSSSIVSPLAYKQEPAIKAMLSANRGKRLLKGFLVGGRHTPPRLYNFSRKEHDDHSPDYPTGVSDADISEGQYFAKPATPTMESYVQISVNGPPKNNAGGEIAARADARAENPGDRGNVKKGKGMLQRMKGGNVRH